MQPSVSFISWPKCQNKSFLCTGSFWLNCCVPLRGRHVTFLLQDDYLQKAVILAKTLNKNNYSTWWDARITCFHSEKKKNKACPTCSVCGLTAVLINVTLSAVTSSLIMRWNKIIWPTAVHMTHLQNKSLHVT